jgi:hypothetical protein
MSMNPPFSQGGSLQGTFPGTRSSNPFAEQVNPYAAPQVATSYQMPGMSTNDFDGIWRQGNLLVMHKMAPIPDICWLSNQPANRRLPRTLYWHQPWIYVIFLISPVIYIIVALVMQKSAKIHLPLTEEWYVRRRTRMLIAWGLGLFSLIGLGGAAIALSDTLRESSALMFVAALLISLGSLIYGLIACRLISPHRITDQYVWVKGVHPDYLNRLEPWVWNV